LLKRFLRILALKHIYKRGSFGFFFWPLPTPSNHDVNYLDSNYVKELSCTSNLFWISGSWDNFQIVRHYFCMFVIICNYFPFKKDMVLYLDKIEFPSCKGDLNQVWKKYVYWFRRSFFFPYGHVKLVFPYRDPIHPLGTMILIILNLHRIRRFSYKPQLFWPSGCLKEDF
jgi:hypothetical protein